MKQCYHCVSSFDHEGDPVDGNDFCSHQCSSDYIQWVNEVQGFVGCTTEQVKRLNDEHASKDNTGTKDPGEARRKKFLVGVLDQVGKPTQAEKNDEELNRVKAKHNEEIERAKADLPRFREYLKTNNLKVVDNKLVPRGEDKNEKSKDLPTKGQTEEL